MKTSLQSDQNTLEIRFKGTTLTIKAGENARMQFLDEDELIDVLHQRMGKSKSEARALMEFYTHPVVNS